VEDNSGYLDMGNFEHQEVEVFFVPVGRVRQSMLAQLPVACGRHGGAPCGIDWNSFKTNLVPTSFPAGFAGSESTFGTLPRPQSISIVVCIK
jgi:hypothetical protein